MQLKLVDAEKRQQSAKVRIVLSTSIVTLVADQMIFAFSARQFTENIIL